MRQTKAEDQADQRINRNFTGGKWFTVATIDDAAKVAQLCAMYGVNAQGVTGIIIDASDPAGYGEMWLTKVAKPRHPAAMYYKASDKPTKGKFPTAAEIETDSERFSAAQSALEDVDKAAADLDQELQAAETDITAKIAALESQKREIYTVSETQPQPAREMSHAAAVEALEACQIPLPAKLFELQTDEESADHPKDIADARTRRADLVANLLGIHAPTDAEIKAYSYAFTEYTPESLIKALTAVKAAHNTLDMVTANHYMREREFGGLGYGVPIFTRIPAPATPYELGTQTPEEDAATEAKNTQLAAQLSAALNPVAVLENLPGHDATPPQANATPTPSGLQAVFYQHHAGHNAADKAAIAAIEAAFRDGNQFETGLYARDLLEAVLTGFNFDQIAAALVQLATHYARMNEADATRIGAHTVGGQNCQRTAQHWAQVAAVYAQANELAARIDQTPEELPEPDSIPCRVCGKPSEFGVCAKHDQF